MKRKIKWKRNPFDQRFINHIVGVLLYGSGITLSAGINYYYIGNECDDCGKFYNSCKCEGSREISGSCEYCGFNRCLCDLEINFNNYYSPKTILAALKWVNENLSKEEIEQIKKAVI